MSGSDSEREARDDFSSSVFEAQRAGGGRRRVVDGAVFGLYEDDDEGDRHPPVLLLAVLVVAILGVAFLVWRAVNTGAELTAPTEEPPVVTVPVQERPTVDDLRLLVPPAIDGCQAPAEQPTDEPPRVLLQCPGHGGPETINFFLYADLDARDEAFEFVAGLLGLEGDAGGTDCALGRAGLHDYIGVETVGRVACLSAEDRTDFVWTSDAAALLVAATGAGTHGEHYRSWAALVDRIDAAFPVGVERVLLDQLPPAVAGDCDRAIDLNVEAGGQAAVVCRPASGPVRRMSSVQFASADDLRSWIQARRDALDDATVSTEPGACTSDGFGHPEATGVDDAGADPSASTTTTMPAPDAGFGPYDIDGSTGVVLCHRRADGTATVAWVRDGSRIGSVVEADRSVTMAQLLSWWEAGGHRP